MPWARDGDSAWGVALVNKFGAIDLTGDSASEQPPFVKVLDEWMYVLESASFNVSVLTLDLQTTEELPLVRLAAGHRCRRRCFLCRSSAHARVSCATVRLQFLEATNCIKTPTNQILWAALDTVMQVR